MLCGSGTADPLAIRVWPGLDSVRGPIQPKVSCRESPKRHISETSGREGLQELFPRIAFRAPPPLDQYLCFRSFFS
jgi:hypothetical protein